MGKHTEEMGGLTDKVRDEQEDVLHLWGDVVRFGSHGER